MFPTRPRLAARSMCSSCGTPACITATRVSCGVQLIRMSSVIYGQAPRQGRAACLDSRTSADASVSPPEVSSSSSSLEFRDQLRGPLPACVRFGAANAANVIVGGFPRPERLVDVGAASRTLAQHQYFERNADLLQELAPARAARGEVDLRLRRCGLHARWYGRWLRIEAAR